MKKIFIAVALSLIICGCANNPSVDEHPTKEEWLEVYTCHEIREVTDLWKQRISVSVTFIQKSKDFVVTLTSANGQEELSEDKRNVYVQDAERIVNRILEKYKWAKDYKLTVQYI